MPLIEIKHRYTGEVLHSGEYADMRAAVIYCVVNKINLRSSDLSGSDLRYSDLSGSDLSGSDLRGSDLSGSDLSDAKNADLVKSRTLIVADGDLRVWKKCMNGVLVHLLIPTEAKRSNATGRKCRAEYADVLEVIGSDVGVSLHDGETTYRKGERVHCDKWEENRFIECGGGIHFYLTRIEAENN